MNDIIELGSEKNLNGKAGNLNRLYNEFNIAKGFIISNDFFLKFLRLNNISFNDKNKEDKILNGVFPNENEFIEYFHKNYKKVIVRSSASIEDGNNISFAGQFDSFLNTSSEDLIFNIKKCWISMFSKSVNDYLIQNNISSEFTFDILVQEMIVSNYSGIAFSLNPVNGNNECVIEISKSQCEEIVSGKVVPEIFKVKYDKAIDNFSFKKETQEVLRNIQKLKKIFNKEIEIEFCFKDNIFYLFQVRPITKFFFSLSDYINQEFWCCFKNNNWSLFNRTLWIMGVSKFKNKNINNDITEDITLYFKHNKKQLRGFNGNQPQLDEITIKNNTAEDINRYLNESEFYSNEVKKYSIVIKENIRNNNYKDFCKNLREIIKVNAIVNSYEYLIAGLGQALFNDLDKETLNNIELWKNRTDNSYFPIYGEIFKYVMNYFNIEINEDLFKNYISVNELLNLCSYKLSVSSLIYRIKKREENGFVLLNLRKKRYNNKIIQNSNIIKVVENRFLELLNCESDKKIDGIKGNSTFKNGKKILGKCVVLKNNDEISNYDLKNKILICDVTTAKDGEFIKNVKALIVNCGGILCHSAIFSREYGIPCLMGCKNATNVFDTGDKVLFDVDKEIIRKIE